MAFPVTIPKLGLTMTEGKVVRWHKRPGERVEKGKALFVLETEKVTYEVEAPASGILGRILVGEGETAPVGTVVVHILEPGEVEPPQEERPRVSPLARRLAEEHGVDLAQVRGTGPGGRVVKEDVLRALEEKARTAPGRPGKLVPLTSLRQTVARRMVESFTTAPHFYLLVEADASGLLETLQHLSPLVERKAGLKPTLTDLVVMLAARALREFPQVNATWTSQGILLLEEVNIGLATAAEGGLTVPVIFGADGRDLADIALARADLVERAREGKLRLEEVQGSTFTISNMGMYGVDILIPILNPPEAALLGLGAIREKPVAEGGQVLIRPRLPLTLTLDHRVLDGAAASPFLNRIKDLVENPPALPV